MILYILKSIGCLALLLFFYHLILEKEKMHNFNRFYLLGSVLFSLLAPLATITIVPIPQIIPETIAVTQNFAEPTFVENTVPIILEEAFDHTKLIIGFCFLISSLFLIRFGKNLFKIIQKIRLNKKINYENAILVLVDDKILPHTFWRYIFINKKDYFNEKVEKELFTHELTHVTQKHTIDVLLIELLQIVFWINPLFIFLKKAIQLNHEFMADETVINQHKNIFQYQHLLLNKAAWNNEYYLASNLNYSLTKKRLLMMTTQSSNTKILLKKLAVIPLLIGFIFLFAERVEAQKKIEVINEQPKNIQKGNNENSSDLYTKFVYKNGYIQTIDKNGKKVNKKYSELTEEEKKKLPPPPPIKSLKKVPTQKLIEDLKDNSKYAIWIDEKVVKNDVLNNYKNTDFSNYFVSFVHKNARSKSFPQEYQASLVTHKYFEAQNEKKVTNFKQYLKKENKIVQVVEEKINKTSLEKYNKINKLYENFRNKKPHFVRSSKERQYDLTEQFSLLGTLYFKLSQEDKKKVKRPIHPHQPYVRLMKNNKVFYKLKTELTKEDKLLIPPPPPVPNATKEQILKAEKAYKEWKKRTGNDFMIPPPPPPKNHLDEVIKMAKKGAEFYYKEKSISSDKAIDMLKKNKKLSIHSESTNNSNYKVWITTTPIKN